ncbi:MAG: hypothetical protein IKG30_01100 [Clostridiales bacterium]|nr:hypothetical protein [Clostridiales bacterium]
MSPLDILIFLFFILVTIKAAASCIDYWRDAEEAFDEAAPARPLKPAASLSRTVRTGRPSSVRVTPIKRVNTPISASYSNCLIDQQLQLKDKGAA